MADTLQSQLRITAWPGVPLPLPDAVRLESVLDAEEGVIVPKAEGGPGAWVELEQVVPVAGETYLQLAEVDLDDPSSIMAFVSRYGPLGGAAAYTLRERREEIGRASCRERVKIA